MIRPGCRLLALCFLASIYGLFAQRAGAGEIEIEKDVEYSQPSRSASQVDALPAQADRRPGAGRGLHSWRRLGRRQSRCAGRGPAKNWPGAVSWP